MFDTTNHGQDLNAALKACLDVPEPWFTAALIMRGEDGNIYTSEGVKEFEEYVGWTYEGGIEWPSLPENSTRIMETYEIVDEPSHLRYHFSDEIKAFEAGEVNQITFEQIIVDDLEPEYEDEDTTVGYVITIRTLEEPEYSVL